ncbi:MAG: endolytic transglycosylase MltG [Mediterranea sp.]|jgi:UPF0755 protein|nr:endolytic transglycosylase MltG [Mediterranea sp.]
MSKTLKIFLAVLCISAVAALVLGGTVYYHLFSPQFYPSKKDARIYIDPDDTIDSIYNKVRIAGNPNSLKGFRWLTGYKRYGNNIRTGCYRIKQGDNAYHLYQRLARGVQTPVSLTVRSVRTFDQLARSVGNQLMIDSAEIAHQLNDSTFVNSLGYTKETLYCFFIPNTYKVYWDISAGKFFDRMKKEHKRFWNKERLAKAKAIGLTPEQVCTVASIVDEETNYAPEKPTVAGLYINRLHKGIALQADPTVKFALQDFGLRRIINAHLQVNSPYNTYKYRGLPPGPIRIPSIKAIDSVLNYEKHDYLYMCAKEDFSGSHNFSLTLAQHMANARKYWKALNDRKIYK